MTDKSNELALCIINDGSSYEHRLHVARREQRLQPVPWVLVCTDAARKYAREFHTQSHWSTVFTPEDILLCAAELANYYAEHIKEIDGG